MMNCLVRVFPKAQQSQNDYALDVSTTTIGHSHSPSKGEGIIGRNTLVRPTETLQNTFINGCA